MLKNEVIRVNGHIFRSKWRIQNLGPTIRLFTAQDTYLPHEKYTPCSKLFFLNWKNVITDIQVILYTSMPWLSCYASILCTCSLEQILDRQQMIYICHIRPYGASVLTILVPNFLFVCFLFVCWHKKWEIFTPIT